MANDFPKPPFPDQRQPMPGSSAAMDPPPDHGEDSYKGSGRLEDKKAIITGGDSGIGRAVAIAFAREGADVLVSLSRRGRRCAGDRALVEDAGRKAVLMPGDIKDPRIAAPWSSEAVEEFGRIDILVNNAAHQASYETSRRSATKSGT